MTWCKNWGEQIIKFRFGHDEWWHTDPANTPQAKRPAGSSESHSVLHILSSCCIPIALT